MPIEIHRAERSEDAYTPIWAPLLAFNQQAVGDAEGVPYALTLNETGSTEILGGLWALSLWGSFYIGLVVTPHDARGQGIGRELMARAEAEAISLGCRNIWLDTYAFQARGFYESMGFQVFGQIDGPAPVFPRFFMKKEI